MKEMQEMQDPYNVADLEQEENAINNQNNQNVQNVQEGLNNPINNNNVVDNNLNNNNQNNNVVDNNNLNNNNQNNNNIVNNEGVVNNNNDNNEIQNENIDNNNDNNIDNNNNDNIINEHNDNVNNDLNNNQNNNNIDNNNNQNDNNINEENMENLNINQEMENQNNINNQNNNVINNEIQNNIEINNENQNNNEINVQELQNNVINDDDEAIEFENPNPQRNKNIQAQLDQIKKENEELRKKNEQLEAENNRLKGKKKKKSKKKDKKEEKKDERTAEQKGYTEVAHDKLEGITEDQAGKINRLKHLTREMTRGAKRGFSSDNYRHIVNDLNALDEFMKEISGRTNLTAEEMETYDKLSLAVYNSSKEYLTEKAMLREPEAVDREEGKVISVTVGTETKEMMYDSDYERSRIRTVEKIQNDIMNMRKEMISHQIEAKKDEMSKAFAQGKMDEELTREQMVGQNLNEADMKKSIAKSQFYDKQISNLDKQGVFSLKPEESFVSALKRIDANTKPTEENLNAIMDHPLGKELIRQGIEKHKAGAALKSADMDKITQDFNVKEGNRRRAEQLRQNNIRPINQPNNEIQNPELQQRQPGI